MKLYTEEQLQEAYNRGLMDGRLNNVDYSIPDGFTPIELPKDEDIEKNIEKLFYGEKKYYFKAGITWMKQHILNQNK